MTNIDPLLHDYKEIEPAFLDQAIRDQLTVDPDRVLDDVRSVEQALPQNPAGMALLLRDHRLAV